jgi:hypothetical protein
MVGKKRSARKSRANGASAKRIHRKKKYWNDQLSQFHEYDLGNVKGKVRTYEQNKCVLQAMKLALQICVDLMNDTDSNFSSSDINWTKIDHYIQQNMGMKLNHVIELREEFLKNGNVLVFGKNIENDDNNHNNINPQSKLTRDQITGILQEVDRAHSNGESVTRQIMINYVRQTYDITVTKSTMSNYFRQLGLSWQNIKTKRRNVGAYRMDILRDYLIKLNDFL